LKYNIVFQLLIVTINLGNLSTLANNALSHIEKSLADSYRKEIDQEENIWRSLPFFATTIALQIAALGQFISWLPPLGTVYSLISIFLLSATGLLMLTALVLLAVCIKPAKFQYIAREPLLFHYAEDLMAAERAAVAAGSANPPNALEGLQKQMSLQYAVGADHNRQITKRREFFRTWAGLAIISSMTATLFLVATVLIFHYISDNGGITQSDTVSGARHGLVTSI
jgi:hypothetical protein